LGFETLRPWDMEALTSGKPRLQPYTSITELEQLAGSSGRRRVGKVG
jgi:hypothetical protein